MRYLIISDIHGNWEALEAVIRDADGRYDTILCCGDLVGYGADPNRVVEWARPNVLIVVRGNHDKACSGLEDFEWFNPVAQAAARWTMAELADENLAYLRELPKGPIVFDGFQLLHGSPADEDEYLVGSYDAEQARGYLDAELSFFGHTHLQGGFLLHRSGIRRIERPEAGEQERVLPLDLSMLHLINPGSVGQPRDRDPRAAYLVYDSDDRLLFYRRVAYRVQEAQRKILEAGLPELLAYRLEDGR